MSGSGFCFFVCLAADFFTESTHGKSSITPPVGEYVCHFQHYQKNEWILYSLLQAFGNPQ